MKNDICVNPHKFQKKQAEHLVMNIVVTVGCSCAFQWTFITKSAVQYQHSGLVELRCVGWCFGETGSSSVTDCSQPEYVGFGCFLSVLQFLYLGLMLLTFTVVDVRLSHESHDPRAQVHIRK